MDYMDSKTLIVERLSLPSNQIHIKEEPFLTNGNPVEAPSQLHPTQTIKEIKKTDHCFPINCQYTDQIQPISFEETAPAPSTPTISLELCHIPLDLSNKTEVNNFSVEGHIITNQRTARSGIAPSKSRGCHSLLPDYDDAKRIPGTDQFIYPRATISTEYKERYPQLVDFFKRAVDNHKTLKHHAKDINYDLRLCGSSPTSALPSIVVFCFFHAEAVFKALRSLFDCRHIRRQYQLENSFASSKFHFISIKSRPLSSSPSIVPFKLLYWRHSSSPTDRRAAMAQVHSENSSPLTMCGSLVKYGDRTSTLGLLVNVDSRLYGLTVDHLFSSQGAKRDETFTTQSDIMSEAETEDAQERIEILEDHWMDDVIYHAIDYDEQIVEFSKTEIRLPVEMNAHVESNLAQHLGGPFLGHKFDATRELHPPSPFLDWALIEFDDGYFKRPNAVHSEDGLKYLKLLTKTSSLPCLNDNGIQVLMISGASKIRNGVLLNGDAYIGSEPGQDLCKAWNVSLYDAIGTLKTYLKISFKQF
jgi:hypothetical protein